MGHGEYLCCEKRLRGGRWGGIQAMKVTLKEGLDLWFLDRTPKGGIFTARF